ncbi:hypothetical protein CR513_10873, partial [Mucuna pruriens]
MIVDKHINVELTLGKYMDEILCDVVLDDCALTRFDLGANVVGVMKVVVVQPPLQLQPLVIKTNKLQVEQKERLLQDLKKLRDIYEHLVKHSTLRFLLKKPPEDVALELLRWEANYVHVSQLLNYNDDGLCDNDSDDDDNGNEGDIPCGSSTDTDMK